MKLILLAALFSFTLYAGEKGNGEDPMGNVDAEFIAASGEVCKEIVNSIPNGTEEETITVILNDKERTYSRASVMEHCCQFEFGPACKDPLI